MNCGVWCIHTLLKCTLISIPILFVTATSLNLVFKRFTFSIQYLSATDSMGNLRLLEIYRQYIGAGCIRAAIARQQSIEKVSSSAQTVDPIDTQPTAWAVLFLHMSFNISTDLKTEQAHEKKVRVEKASSMNHGAPLT